ncbi:hypothetical protein B6I21_04050 [candidate division KSB1 bacterium 4572_119]|nr:MAG: hypothetical protein B6I21_04050 [candidate division KSB1 bacterium 4572_119]
MIFVSCLTFHVSLKSLEFVQLCVLMNLWQKQTNLNSYKLFNDIFNTIKFEIFINIELFLSKSKQNIEHSRGKWNVKK